MFEISVKRVHAPGGIKRLRLYPRVVPDCLPLVPDYLPLVPGCLTFLCMVIFRGTVMCYPGRQ